MHDMWERLNPQERCPHIWSPRYAPDGRLLLRCTRPRGGLRLPGCGAERDWSAARERYEQARGLR